MISLKKLGLSVATAAMFAASPTFGETPLRIRGSVVSIDVGSITVKEQTGKEQTGKERTGGAYRLSTDFGTTYAEVVPSTLEAIKATSYIGSAVKGPMNDLVAVEVALIPESMRAGRVGYYRWDRLPDVSGAGAPNVVDTAMTNGSVLAVSPRSPKLPDPGVANGTVASDKANAAGRVLTVDLAGGRTVRIAVPLRAPIVRFVPSSRSALSLGASVVVWTTPGDKARLVAVGKGVAPPM